MKKSRKPQSGIFKLLSAVALCLCGIILGTLSFASVPGENLLTASVHVPELPKAPLWFEPANRAKLLSDQASGPISQQFSPQITTSLPSTSAAWSLVNSPNDLTLVDNTFSGIACVSASDCWAVGTHGLFDPQTLIEHWDGSSWTIVESPSREESDGNYLQSVVCVSRSECWAVGYNTLPGSSFRPTLVERWDGNSWTIVESPNATATYINILSSVACASASECWTVGRYFGDGGIVHTLVERWDGNSWSIVSSPNVSDTEDSTLFGVACASASDCWAVGYHAVSGSGNHALIERWDGSSWTIDNSMSSVPGTSALSAVTCVSSSQCWGVGYLGDGITLAHTLMVQWNGISWSVVPAPASSPNGNNYLNNVSCVSASDCWAVGGQNGDALSGFQTLIEHWNGIAWIATSSPNPSATANNISAVSCAADASCWVAGSYYAGQSVDHTFSARWDGNAWNLVLTSNIPPTATDNLLWGVGCTSISDCWGVGYYWAGFFYQTLVEHWDGASWQIVNTPNVNELNNGLFGVSCVSSSDCWAVGRYFDSTIGIGGEGAYQTLAEHWDGRSWTIVNTPNYGAGLNNGFESVTCLSTSECWAVGYYYVPAPGAHGESPPLTLQTLIERWDGISWTIVPSANSSPNDYNFLFGVTCASESDCWAVGNTYNKSNDQTLIEHWDGTSWTITSSPNTSMTDDNDLSSVACTPNGQCWAIGAYFHSGGWVQSLIENWNGASWTIVESPNTSTDQHNLPLAIACASDAECWAIGLYVDGIPRTLIERWDGTSWALFSSPNTSDWERNFLYAATCIPNSQCWAVGVAVGASGYTLTEAFAPPAQLTSVSSRKIHGSAGTFDVDLINGAGIECRSGGASGDYTLVFTFANTLRNARSASVTAGTGSVATDHIDANDAHNYVVDLTGVTNAQTVTVALNNVVDSLGGISTTVPVSFKVVIGDTTGNGVVNSSDIAKVQSQSGQLVTSSNFREDVTANGSINSSDIALVQSHSGTGLPITTPVQQSSGASVRPFEAPKTQKQPPQRPTNRQ